MGLYAHNGQMKAKDAEGKPLQFSIEQLKAAGRRHTPNEEDVQLLLCELNMKKMDMGSTTIDTGIMADKFNGHRKKNKNWGTYVERLNTNVPLYQKAEKDGLRHRMLD